jgi:hypothetical protein
MIESWHLGTLGRASNIDFESVIVDLTKDLRKYTGKDIRCKSLKHILLLGRLWNVESLKSSTRPCALASNFYFPPNNMLNVLARNYS